MAAAEEEVAEDGLAEQEGGDQEEEQEEAEEDFANGPAETLYLCNICEEDLPGEAFPQRNGKKIGATCEDCQLAVEGLQRQFKSDWGKTQYPVKWKAFRKDRSAFQEKVIDFRLNNPRGKGHRKIKLNTRQLCQTKRKLKRKSRKRGREPMTWHQFQDWFCSVKGGSHTKPQAIEKWKSFAQEASQKKMRTDKLGIYQGKSNQLRYWVPCREGETSESASESAREDIRSGKPQKRLKEDDVNDFMGGDADLSDASMEGKEARPVKRRKLEAPAEHEQESAPAASSASSPAGKRIAVAGASPAPAAKRARIESPASAKKPWDGQMPREKAKTAWRQSMEDQVKAMTAAVQDATATLQKCVFADGAKVPEKVALFPKFVEMVEQRQAVAQAWLDGTSKLEDLQMNDEWEPYLGWLDLKAKEVMDELVEQIAGVQSAADLTAQKASLAVEKKAAAKCLSEIKAAVKELEDQYNRHNKRLADASGVKVATAKKATKGAPAATVKKEPDTSNPQSAVAVEMPAVLKDTSSIRPVAEVKIDCVALNRAVVEQHLQADRIDLNAPYVIHLQKVTSALRADSRLQLAIGDFKADFLTSNFYQASGRASRPCSSTVAAARAMQALVPFKIDPQSWLKEVDPSFKVQAEKHLLPMALHVFGMAPTRHYAGPIFNGFGTLQWLLEGSKTVIVLKWATALEFLYKNQKGAVGEPPDEFEEDWDSEEVSKRLLELQGEALERFMKLDLRVHLQKQDSCLYVPAGWIVIERCMSSTAMGLRKTIAPSTQEALDGIVGMNLMERKFPRPVHVFCQAAVKVTTTLKVDFDKIQKNMERASSAEEARAAAPSQVPVVAVPGDSDQQSKDIATEEAEKKDEDDKDDDETTNKEAGGS